MLRASLQLRFSPGDGASFLAELQQAIEEDKVLQAAWNRLKDSWNE